MLEIWHRIHDLPRYKKLYHVAKTMLALQYLKFYPQVEIIAIAGSVGKTTTKEAVVSVLKQKYKVKYSKANIDPVFNIPSTILKLRKGDQKLVLEVGIEYPGDMAYYMGLIKPRIGIMTRITLEHSEFLGTMQQIANHEAELLQALPKSGLAIINGDDEYSRKMAGRANALIAWYGFGNEYMVQAQDFEHTEKGSRFVLRVESKEASVAWPMAGKHTVYAALAAAAVGRHYDFPISTIRKGLESLQPPTARMNIIVRHGVAIIDDAYNSSPAAVVAALDTLVSRKQKQGRTIAILATMKELGTDSEDAHREVGRKVAEVNPDFLILWGEYTPFIAEEAMKYGYAKECVRSVVSFAEIIDWLKKNTKMKDTVLVKGSRHHIHLERVALAMQNKPTAIHCPICPECN